MAKSALRAQLEHPLAKRTNKLLNWLTSIVMAGFAKSTPLGAVGFVALSPIMGIVGTVLLVIIVVLVLAALAPTFFQAVADITGALLNADLNSTLANTIAAIVAILVPLALLFGFVFLIFKSTKMGGR